MPKEFFRIVIKLGKRTATSVIVGSYQDDDKEIFLYGGKKITIFELKEIIKKSVSEALECGCVIPEIELDEDGYCGC